MTELLPLETWVERRYPVRAPNIQTVRRWVREGKIHPPPQKHGRAYYVQTDAEYLTDETLVRRLSGPKATQ